MPHPKAVPITLDKARSLLYNLNALCLLKERCGINILTPDREQLEDPVAVRAIAWAGLVHEDPALTLDQVGEMVTDLPGVSVKIGEALAMSTRPEVAADVPLPKGAKKKAP